MRWFRPLLVKIFLRLSSVTSGLLAGAIVLICALSCSLTLYFSSVEALKEAVRTNLTRAASQAASVIDGEGHRQFHSKRQESSAEYRLAIKPLERMLESTDDLAFVYTCVLIDNKVYFVLDPTEEGDNDGDGVDDKSHIMEPYPDATPAMFQALRENKPAADEEPSIDKWGTFISGYAPLHDANGKCDGIVGVDLSAEKYVARLAILQSAVTFTLIVALLMSAAVGVGVAILRRSLLEAKAQRQLDRSKTEIIERLVRAAEYRDDATGEHVVRMAKYCEALARSIGLSEPDCSMLRMAAPMHDVGKIGIPDAILLKQGKLTPEEFEVIKTHTVMGADLLSGSEYELLRMAEVIALTHHERWDGTGYPGGLKGEDIPLTGRISAVCDIFDALTSARPYKEAWSFEKASDELRSLSSNSLEPRLVQAFLQILPEIRSIRGQNADEQPLQLPAAA